MIDVPLRGLVSVIELLDGGGTVPFIARYRKEATGNLDEVKVREIEEQLAYFRDLVSRRETILHSIEEQGKLTEELRARIEKCLDKSEIEDIYLPFKPKRRTKPPSRARRGWSRWHNTSGDSNSPSFRSAILPRHSSVKRKALPTSMKRWKARAISWLKSSAKTPTCARLCASACSTRA
jgi:hypothetical protein